jgi:hypothetical protein
MQPNALLIWQNRVLQEASRAMVSQSGLKTGKGAMTGGARCINVEVASSRS